MIGVLLVARPHKAWCSWVPVLTVTVAPPAPPVVPPFRVDQPTWAVLPPEEEVVEPLLDEDELLDEELELLLDEDELLEEELDELLLEDELEEELLELDELLLEDELLELPLLVVGA
jgi:hypothetical protein